MGRYVKNFETDTNAYATRLPVGNSIIAPDHPVDGQIRFNKDNNSVEYYANSAWNRFSKFGKIDVVKDTFIGNGTDFQFSPLSKSYQSGRETDVLVFVGSIFQDPGVAYNMIGDVISFTSAPPFLEPIIVLHNLNSTETV